MTLHLSEEEYLDMMQNNKDLGAGTTVKARPSCETVGTTVKATPNKYHAQKTVIETVYGMLSCDSKREAEIISESNLKVKAGLIKGFLVQIPFRLPGGIVHRVDLGEINPDGSVRWVEVKGFRHAVGEMKRKMTEELYHVNIEVVK